jgi:hypothetical protein
VELAPEPVTVDVCVQEIILIQPHRIAVVYLKFLLAVICRVTSLF